MDFNAKNCHILEIVTSKKRPPGNTNWGKKAVSKTKEGNGLGVTIHDDLSLEHITRTLGGVYILLNIIKVAFNSMDEGMLK